jgi:hypothetical protein
VVDPYDLFLDQCVGRRMTRAGLNPPDQTPEPTAEPTPGPTTEPTPTPGPTATPEPTETPIDDTFERRRQLRETRED